MRRDIAQLRSIFDREARSYLEGLPHESLYEPIAYALEGNGKRIRPLLVLMGCEVFSKDIAPAMPAALAVEVFHNFTLVHDDIMDEAPLRRGRPTVHEKWNANAAILSGDAMLIEAYSLINRLDVDPEVRQKVIAVFNRVALGVCRGQQYDMDFEQRREVSVGEYLEMIELKTAVLLGGSLEIGALIGGASQREADELYAFGKAAGVAFQLQDDYLDAFGDPETFGKKPGGDIRSNKKTFLIIRALEKASAKQRRELQALYDRPTDDEGDAEKVERVTAVFRNLEIDRETQDLSDRHFAEALKHLHRVSAGPFVKKALHDFLIALRERRR